MLLFIDWQPSGEIFQLGNFSVRWYSMCWIVGILLANLLMKRLYALEGIDPAPDAKGKLQPTGKFDPLIFYCFIGVVAGARLGHCIFYEPARYLTSVNGWIEMLLPVHIAPDGWHFVGYSGLASHGGTIGLFLAVLLYIRNSGLKAWCVLDLLGIVAPVAACFIRLGNLMNSEIIGRATDMPWGFIFHTQDALVNGQLAPRHPAQLYEAIAYAVILAVGWWIYTRRYESTAVGTGFHFGFCLAAIFLFRFFVEFVKEVQGGTDDGTLLLDMGQLLSIPFVIAGIACMLRKRLFAKH